MVQRVIGVDPGSESSGVCVLDNKSIIAAFNVSNDLFFTKVSNFLIHSNCRVALEAIRPYSLRLTQQVIETCQWIGEAKFRLENGSGVVVELIPRNNVKKWVFDTFPEIVLPTIEGKILKKGFVNKDGEPRKPSFVFVDDKIVTDAMKEMYGIKKPPPGKGYEYGLKSHSFQALALASFIIDSKAPSQEHYCN